LVSNRTQGKSHLKTSEPHFDTIVGEYVNDEYVVAANIYSKVSDWEDQINNGSSLSVSFYEVRIEMEGGVYYLV
jgi:hypothetical protein